VRVGKLLENLTGEWEVVVGMVTSVHIADKTAQRSEAN
jgi:hypothetical protein